MKYFLCPMRIGLSHLTSNQSPFSLCSGHTGFLVLYTHQAQIHLGAVDLLFPLPAISTRLAPSLHLVLFSISSLNIRLPKIIYLKKGPLVILDYLTLLYFSSQLLSLSVGALVYMVASFPNYNINSTWAYFQSVLFITLSQMSRTVSSM